MTRSKSYLVKREESRRNGIIRREVQRSIVLNDTPTAFATSPFEISRFGTL